MQCVGDHTQQCPRSHSPGKEIVERIRFKEFRLQLSDDVIDETRKLGRNLERLWIELVPEVEDARQSSKPIADENRSANLIVEESSLLHDFADHSCVSVKKSII